MVYVEPLKKNQKKKVDPVAMKFQQRDGVILQTIHEYDGVIARRHLRHIFWPGKSWRAMDYRLSKLFHNGYINRPSPTQRNLHPIPEPVVWLGWRGALFVAGSSGVVVHPPTGENENQIRSLQRRLRQEGFRWLREPRWSQLAHDLKVVDFRLVLLRSVEVIPQLTLGTWQNESYFRSNPDVITFQARGRDGSTRTRKKGVIPDGYFEIIDEKRRALGKVHKARFLLELDMATHDTPSFGVEKAVAGAAYIKSSLYKSRFGANAGRWLVVTTGEVRMKNLMKQTGERTGSDADLFFFTIYDELKNQNMLTEPLWWQVGGEVPLPLIKE